MPKKNTLPLAACFDNSSNKSKHSSASIQLLRFFSVSFVTITLCVGFRNIHLRFFCKRFCCPNSFVVTVICCVANLYILYSNVTTLSRVLNVVFILSSRLLQGYPDISQGSFHKIVSHNHEHLHPYGDDNCCA